MGQSHSTEDRQNEIASSPSAPRNDGGEATGPYDEARGAELEGSPIECLRNIIDPEQLSQGMIEDILSAIFSNKRLVLAFRRDLYGFKTKQQETIVSQLERWKAEMVRRNPDMKKLLGNFHTFKYSDEDELKRSLGAHPEIDLNDRDKNLIFTYEPVTAGGAGTTMSIGNAIRPVYINEGEGFTIDSYYPLIEVVTISIMAGLLGWGKEDIDRRLAELDIDKTVLNIKDIDQAGAAFIFSLIPKTKRYENEDRVDRYTRILRFLHSA